MSSVLDNVLSNIATQLATVATALGYTNPVIARDEYGLIEFPPDPNSELVKVGAFHAVIQLPEFELGPPVSNTDKFRQHVILQAFIYTGIPVNASTESTVDLTGSVEAALKATMKQIRTDLTRGGYADNTLGFRGKRWAWGDGSGAGFGLEFDVIYRTNYNDPDTKG